MIQQYEFLHIDATLTPDYPLRILRAYREHCNSRWSSSGCGGETDSPLIQKLNELQEQQAELLDKTLAILEAKSL